MILLIIGFILASLGSIGQLKNLISVNTLLPLGAVLTTAILMLKMVANKMPALKKFFKKFLLYALLYALVMGLFLAILYNLKQSELILRYFAILGFMFLLGIVHTYCYRAQFDRMDSENYLSELLLAVIVGAFLGLPIIIAVSYFNDGQFLYYYFVGILAFIFPTAVFALFNYSVSIPAKVYQKWYYPLGNKYDPPKHYELKNMIILNFMFYKNKKEQHMTSFKVKAPRDMNFGRLFFFFVNDYNAKNVKNKIEMLQENDDPFGWYYSSKPKWYGGSKPINFEITVENNNLKDGDSVICQRI